MDNHTKIKNEKNETLKAGCVVVDKDKVLLVSDMEGKIWTFPKGHAENGETLEQVAVRETKEETGYEVEIENRLSDVTYTHGKTGELIRVAMFRAKPLEKTDAIEKDIQSVWFSIDEAEKKLYHNLVFLLKELKSNPQKIIIMGDSGRGKSALAKRLSEKLKIPFHSTDDYFYEIKFSKPRDKQESIKMISELFHEPQWIVEGTTHHLIEQGLAPADIIIHLTYKNIFYQWVNQIKRHFQRDDESLIGLYQLMKHSLYKKYGWGYKKGKVNNEGLIAPYKNKVIMLSSFKEIDDFVNNL